MTILTFRNGRLECRVRLPASGKLSSVVAGRIRRELRGPIDGRITDDAGNAYTAEPTERGGLTVARA